MQHPADGEAWKEFDRMFPEFDADPRNVRLGLATDGFNSYGVLNQHHSTWPIFVFPHNLPHWKCMKKEYVMMTVLITEDPGRSIDVYLRSLVDELEDLWTNGVHTYDKSTGKIFTLQAVVMWTVNDFPAYAMVSGWSTKGYIACPVYTEDVTSVSQRYASNIARCLRHDIVQVLCKFLMIFPPAFFTSMIHVTVHLPEEALLADVETAFNRPQSNNDGGMRNEKLSVFSQSARPFGDPGRGESFSRNHMEVVHWFVLNNCDEIMAYLDEQEEMMKREHPSHLYANKHREFFPQWFSDSVNNNHRIPPLTVMSYIIWHFA
ncbi:hypothetical protein L3X38_001677 [Prunus dulcis]|uniref:DUF4218 domain-containing protein n=1 Tax=Prunus dulcis TaxID=3755 RepID=A0AAD4ZK27_PRUDU|nr:hypothetical protein L3X38_001677 [Prunus dulcis]